MAIEDSSGLANDFQAGWIGWYLACQWLIGGAIACVFGTVVDTRAVFNDLVPIGMLLLCLALVGGVMSAYALWHD